MAQPFSECEITPVGDRFESIPLGRPSTGSRAPVCRRMGSEGPPAPEAVESCEPIKAKFVGPAIEQTEPDGLVEA